MPSPKEIRQAVQNIAISLSTQNGQYLTKTQMLGYFPFPYQGHLLPEHSVDGRHVKEWLGVLPESSFCVHSLSTGTVVNLCYEEVPDYTQSPGGLTMDSVPGCTSLIDNTTIGCRAAFSITCNGALKVSEAAYYIHSGGLGDECVVAGRRDMGASSASGIVKEMSTPNEVKHTVLNRNMAIEQFMEQAARSGLEREGFVELIKREGVEFNGGNYTLASSPETFTWFLNLIDKIKDWPEPKTEEPTASPEQGTSTEQETDISQQPTETVNPYETEAPSPSEQDKPFETAVENTPNTTNSEPKDTEEPRAMGPEQEGVPETQPTDAITEEPRGPEPDPSIIKKPQRTNSSDPEEGKQEKQESTQAPTMDLEAQYGAEDKSSEPTQHIHHHQAGVAQYVIPAVIGIVFIGIAYCSTRQDGWCSGLLSGLFKWCTGNEGQGALTEVSTAGTPRHVSLTVSPTPDTSPYVTPTTGKLNSYTGDSARHRHPLMILNTLKSQVPDSPKDGFKLPMAYAGSYNTDPLQTQEIPGSFADLGTDPIEVT